MISMIPTNHYNLTNVEITLSTWLSNNPLFGFDVNDK
jgi:hypothetical protein